MLTQKSVVAFSLIKVVRGHIVVGGVLAFTLGALLAVASGSTFNLSRAVLFYAVVLLGDLSTHFSNDYFDAELDKNSETKKFFSGRRILAKNPRLLPKALRIALALLAVSLALACFSVAFGVAPIEALIIAVAANFLGWFYSSPPLRLSSKGLGEVAIALCAGFAIPAFGYLAVNGQLDLVFGVFVVPFVLYAFMLALSLEAPDIELDRKGNRRNIGVVMGKLAVHGFVLAAAFSAFSCFVFYAIFMADLGVNFFVVAVFAAVPLATSISGLICVLVRWRSDVFMTVNVLSLFVFNVLMIGYLAFVVL